METLRQIAPQFGMFYLVTTLFVASIIDISTHRIPNLLLLPALVVAAILGALHNGAAGIFLVLAGLAVGFAMLLPLYITGGTSAGDVKLLAVASSFLGPSVALFAGFFTFVAGAVIGIAWIAWRRYRQPVRYLVANAGIEPDPEPDTNVESPEGTSRHAFAYAPAIFAGVCAAIWYQGWNLSGIS